jgi:hypothetical protein
MYVIKMLLLWAVPFYTQSSFFQDNIKLYGREFVNQVFEKNSTIFVCGDAKNMGKDVLDAVVSVIQNERGINVLIYIPYKLKYCTCRDLH